MAEHRWMTTAQIGRTPVAQVCRRCAITRHRWSEYEWHYQDEGCMVTDPECRQKELYKETVAMAERRRSEC